MTKNAIEAIIFVYATTNTSNVRTISVFVGSVNEIDYKIVSSKGTKCKAKATIRQIAFMNEQCRRAHTKANTGLVVRAND